MEIASEHQPAIRIDLLSGSVSVAGHNVHLARAEVAVLFALAADDRPLARDVLAEKLYPDADGDLAVNAVKVNVFRARHRLQRPDAIRYADGRYSLGWSVDVDFSRLEAMVRRQHAGVLTVPERQVLERIRERARNGRPNFVLTWRWFETVERRVRDLLHDATIILAEDALLQQRHPDAIEFASELILDDPLDETAAEVLVRASVQRGDRTGAALFYKRYADALARELGGTPPPIFRLILDDLAKRTLDVTSFRPVPPIAAL
jgi:DNA-binding SARP family transcriptional activator